MTDGAPALVPVSAAAYTVEVRENGERVSLSPIPDPFINTRVTAKGWGAAWAVLRGRFEVEVIVGGNRDRVEAVLELDPDYLGPAGSRSRRVWDTQIQAALGRGQMGAPVVTQGPSRRVDKAAAETRDLARLRQATWEATQWLSFDELREYVEGVLREVESDDH